MVSRQTLSFSNRLGVCVLRFPFSQAENQLQALTNKELQAERHLAGLAQDVATLQKKSEANRQLAEEARGKAERATTAAGSLERVRLFIPLTQGQHMAAHSPQCSLCV